MLLVPGVDHHGRRQGQRDGGEGQLHLTAVQKVDSGVSETPGEFVNFEGLGGAGGRVVPPLLQPLAAAAIPQFSSELQTLLMNSKDAEERLQVEIRIITITIYSMSNNAINQPIR